MTIQMAESADIQMVEETVTMFLQRGNYPVNSKARNLDQMRYICEFKLRNLSDREVTIQVGFPLAADRVQYATPDNMDHTEIVAYFGFTAGTKDKVYPVRFVPRDKDKKFSRLFLWNMTFAPKEEINLKVVYRMGGGMGFGNFQHDRKASGDYRCPYLRALEMVIGQAHTYVTETGGCWAGKIEKATFRIYYAPFEEYLNKRGLFDWTDEEKKETEADKAKLIAEGRYVNAVRCKIKTVPPVRSWKPGFDEWKECGRYRELVFAPFDTAKLRQLEFGYAFFLSMPVTVDDFELLLKALEQQNSRLSEKYDKAEIERNTADAILEFYGIAAGNEKIQNFLKNQIWYPVKDPRAIDPALKERLLKTK